MIGSGYHFKMTMAEHAEQGDESTLNQLFGLSRSDKESGPWNKHDNLGRQELYRPAKPTAKLQHPQPVDQIH